MSANHNEEEIEIEDESASEEESSETSETSESEYNWIMWFITQRGREFYCQVDEAYIRDGFNLTGLNAVVPEYKRALDMILDVNFPAEKISDERLEQINRSAETLYGLIHSRYIITAEGMNRMLVKYQHVHFGRCPRIYCEGQPVLPVGLSDVPLTQPVCLFCPRCQEVYSPRNSRQAAIDGSFFGTTFCHLFLMTQSQLVPAKSTEAYVPRVFGFRINKGSSYYKNRESPSSSSKKLLSATPASDGVGAGDVSGRAGAV